MISVGVVDDEHLVRSGFAAPLASDPEITVVGTAESGNAALAVVRRERPDVVLMDIRMPGRDGVSATAAITADPALSRTRVIVLTTFDLDEYVHAALRAGASGFLLKDTQPHELLAAIRRPLAFVLVADTVSNFLVFAPVQMLTKGGPEGSTNLLMYDIYTRAFTLGDLSRAQAVVVVLVLVTLAVVTLQFRMLRSEE